MASPVRDWPGTPPRATRVRVDAETPRRFRVPTGFMHMGWYGSGVNDPSAGSPTETLLRLLLPLNDKVQATSRR